MKAIFLVLTLGVWTAAAQFRPPALTSAPFSADEMQSSPFKTEPYLIGHIYRDSAGRTRTESALITGGWKTEITDPINHMSYVLDDEHKVVYRTPVATESIAATAVRPASVGEQLGEQLIGGLKAAGTRTKDGMEKWESIDLWVNLITKSANGYSGWLVNIRRDEPDPALFQIPADYKIVGR